ncbi:MFS transporter [Amycolatopsis orientalis]|uniref:MFS transporter n=1 Tax=Amycolatopsis orientalis TaxID=31958 RepID=UPI00039B356A|nr:MFS transporter [Amycolatopsis orientalis]
MHISSRAAAFAALLLGMLMAALDTNVVVAALPSIGADLGNPGAVGGVTAAYLLAVAVATPVHGSLGDRWGRRRMFVGSVTVFALASLGCALVPDLTALIGLRAVQGLGGSGLIVAAVAAMAELFDRAEMVRRQGWLTAVFAVSSIGGAPLGGLLAASSAGWPSIFLVNLPVSVLALVLGIRSVPGKREQAARRGFDVAGAVLVALVGGSIVALGSSDALARDPVAAPVLAAVALAGTVAFVRVERRAAAPLIPPRLFAEPGVARAVAVTLLSGVALFGSFTYVPLVISENPAATGLLLLPMSVGQVVVTSGFALLARRWPRVTAWGRLGLVLGVVGMLCTASIPLAPGGLRTLAIVVGLACSGAALGLSMQAYTLLAQSMVPKDVLGAGLATLTFARQIGGSLGIAVFGWITLAADSGAALPIVFLLAAVVLLAGVILAPRAAHEPVSA